MHRLHISYGFALVPSRASRAASSSAAAGSAAFVALANSENSPCLCVDRLRNRQSQFDAIHAPLAVVGRSTVAFFGRGGWFKNSNPLRILLPSALNQRSGDLLVRGENDINQNGWSSP